MTDDKLAVSQEARALADELGTITEERHSIVLAALARFEAQARLAGERAGMEWAHMIALGERCERGTPWDLACTTIAAAILKEAASITPTTPGASNE